VRFNPNLYHCGKVCLSLLGTWDGQSGETWMPNTSTLLQLAVSIQSLIFVAQPYFNEPSYECEMGTEHGEAQSRTYNTVIRAGTVAYAMIEMLQSPPQGFEDVVAAHFALRREQILKEVESWGDDVSVAQKKKLQAALEGLKEPAAAAAS